MSHQLIIKVLCLVLAKSTELICALNNVLAKSIVFCGVICCQQWRYQDCSMAHVSYISATVTTPGLGESHCT